MARKLDYGKESSKVPTVIIPCSYEGCPDKAITREYDNKPICRRHYDMRFGDSISRELKSLELLTLEEKQAYCRKMVRELSNKMTGEGNTDWAVRLLKKFEDGDYISPLQQRMAQEALGIKP